jgi:hypothetical protein
MSFEPEPQPEHPTDRVFRIVGHEGLGDTQREYKGRIILLREYFDQPDVAASARAYYDIVNNGDISHPEYETAYAVLASYCEFFAKETAQLQQ